MSHAITRTSPKGGPFIGRCIKCGAEGLGMGAPLENCPADGIVSDEQVLMEMLEAPTFDMSIHHNPDAAAWAALYKSTFPDSDEGLMLSWFANAMMAMYDYTVNTRTDLSQASVAAALEAAGAACTAVADEAKSYHMPQMAMGATTARDAIRALITPDQRTALQAAIDAAKAEARAEDAAVLSKLIEVTETARDYVSDAAMGYVWHQDQSGSPIVKLDTKMPKDDIRAIDQALAAARDVEAALRANATAILTGEMTMKTSVGKAADALLEHIVYYDLVERRGTEIADAVIAELVQVKDDAANDQNVTKP